jgi:hypothetical protein
LGSNASGSAALGREHVEGGDLHGAILCSRKSSGASGHRYHNTVFVRVERAKEHDGRACTKFDAGHASRATALWSDVGSREVKKGRVRGHEHEFVTVVHVGDRNNLVAWLERDDFPFACLGLVALNDSLNNSLTGSDAQGWGVLSERCDTDDPLIFAQLNELRCLDASAE